MGVKCGWRSPKEGDEGNVVATHPFDVAAADNALRVGKQDGLEPHGGWVGGGRVVINC